MARVVRFRDEVEIIPPSSSSCFPAAACNLLKMAGNKITGAVTHLLHGVAHCVHSVATFSGNVWWVFKDVIRPSPMSSLAWTASFPFFLYGYDVAIQDSTFSLRHDIHLSGSELAVYLTCTGRVGYAVGAVAAGVAANYFGRRYVLAAGGVLYTAGTLVVTFTSGYVESTVGRALACFGVGMGLLVGPIFIAETAPSTTRGYHGTFPQVLMVVGTITVHVLELAFLRVPRHLAWRLMLGVSALPSAYFTYAVVSRRFTDTPSWMAMRGQVRAAEVLMERCGASGTESYDRGHHLERLARFLTCHVPDPHADPFPGRITGFWGDVFHYADDYLRDAFAAAVLYVAQEAMFEQMALRLVPTVLTRHTLVSRWSFPVAGLVLALVRLAATSISMHVAGRSMARRRGLLLVGLGVSVCLLGLLSGTAFVDAREHVSSEMAFALTSVGMLALEAAVGVGPGPVPWTYGPEVLPLTVRAPTLGLCLTFKFASGVLLGWTFPQLFFTFHRAWLVFLGAAAVTSLFFLFCCRFVRMTTCRLLMDESD